MKDRGEVNYDTRALAFYQPNDKMVVEKKNKNKCK